MNHQHVLATAIKDAIVTAKTSIELIREAHERIRNDPIALKRLMRAVMGPPRRKLEGDEREHMLTVFRLIDPVDSSNNQHAWTDVYEHAGKTYHVHSFSDADDEVEEILPDDIQQD